MSEMIFPNQNPIDQGRLDQLRAAAGDGPVLILTHDNPDPDALASGKALATLLKQVWEIPCRLQYTGLVARAENRAMLEQLTPEWEQADALTELDRYSSLALVDTQPGAGNNRLPAGYVPQIVIDHHQPQQENLKQVPFVDLRPDVGATVSLVYQYLEAAGVEPDPTLATAMFYGLQTDTRGLARGASMVDEAAYFKLLSRLDRQKLIKVEQAGLTKDYFRAFSQGLQAARVYGRAVIAKLGAMHRPDLAAELADVLIRLEGARAVLCLGHYEGTLYISLRTEPFGQDAGILAQKVVDKLGKAGGHDTMAGGQVPLDGQKLDDLFTEIERRFLAVMGESGTGEPLLAEL